MRSSWEFPPPLDQPPRPSLLLVIIQIEPSGATVAFLSLPNLPLKNSLGSPSCLSPITGITQSLPPRRQAEINDPLTNVMPLQAASEGCQVKTGGVNLESLSISTFEGIEGMVGLGAGLSAVP